MATPTADEARDQALDVIAQAQEAGIRFAGSVAESWTAVLRGIPGVGSVLGADTSGTPFGNSFGNSFGNPSAGPSAPPACRTPPSRPSTASTTPACSSSRRSAPPRTTCSAPWGPRCGR